MAGTIKRGPRCSGSRRGSTKQLVSVVWLVLVLLAGWATAQAVTVQIKKPAVAGGFYPADSAQLAQEIERYISGAEPSLMPGDQLIALIVPHAGIVYSGAIAGYAYRLLKNQQPRTIVLVGPSHYVPFTGVAVYDRGFFQTPLGLIGVDTLLAQRIIAQSESIRFFPEAFAREHNIEVQLPFIQRACPAAKIVPIVMGSQSPEEVQLLKKALVATLPGEDVLLIGSTDLSHYHPATEAGKLDQVCVDDVRRLDGRQLLQDLHQGKTEMCGGGPAAVVLLTAAQLGADVGRILKYGDSGDAGPRDKSAVVGYLAAALVDTNSAGTIEATISDKGNVMVLNESQKKYLLKIARESIAYYLETGEEKKWSNTDPQLDRASGAFVTLKKQGQLRGCIGHVEAVYSLFATVAGCAVSSAVRDPRFPPVTAGELANLQLEISVMTPPTPVDNVEDIVVGRDGLIIEKGRNRGLLLPQVPVEWGWDREEYLQNLCRKAGLGPHDWKSGVTIYSFQALVFGED